MLMQLVLLLVGFVLLVKGADWFVDGAASIAKKLGVSQLIIGLTIVAMGTSLPEAAVSITSALGGNAGISIGNAVGSNIMNILLILGITAAIVNVKIQRSTFRYEIPFMVGITVLLMVLGLTGGALGRAAGLVFWALFIAFFVYLWFIAKHGGPQEEGEAKDMPVWQCILAMLLGGVMVVKGSDFVVSGATGIARAFGMSERFIGLTIVAFGTSLPELVTAVTAAKKGNVDIAIGNIVGSNIFNILFVVGTTALICPIPFERKFAVDTAVAVFAGVLLWAGTAKHKELRRPCGILMLLSYAVYFAYLCLA
ncbi:MAG: calcium/sodium antiporter [Clostridia bacterium]|nr:calcium/sodium antiporter [Clostridia bacterium]